MNADRLLQYYEQIADAPDAIARLRRFILDLAVRGKLVPQDPADESASELLKRIAVEKARLLKAGEIRKEKALPRLSSADRAFELPNQWVWGRLGDLAQLVTSGSRDWAKHYANEGAIFVRMGNLSKDHYRLRLEHVQRVKAPDDGEGTRTRLDAGDILISITGDVGMLGLIPEGFGEAYINQHTAMVRPVVQLRGRYLAELFRSPFAQHQFNEPQRGIKNSFRLSDITQFVVPLPPLVEQHRIVAKVDELMALCDALEAARTERETKRDQLAAASLARLNTPDPETFRDDARFALDALRTLAARPDQIKQLRQTILNLAVRGKLVPQDLADEPAVELLKRIAGKKTDKTRRAELRRNGLPNASLRRAVELEPCNWTWTQLGEVALSMRYGTSVKCGYGTKGAPVLRIPNVSGSRISLDDIKFGPLSPYEMEDLSLREGDILLIRSNGSLEIVGRAAVVTPDAAGMSFAGYLVRLRTDPTEIDPAYIWLALQSSEVRDQIERPIRSAVGLKNVNLTEFGALTFRLPPFAEQHRIVAKVEELMVLCEQLEASLIGADETRKKLLDALLAEALAPVDTEVLREAAE